VTDVGSPIAGIFAQAPNTAEASIAYVHRELMADDGSTGARSAGELDLLAETAVRHLWGGRVTAFVSVLALRDAREALSARGAALQGGAANRPGADDLDLQDCQARGAPKGDKDH
jgi:hypothetical protein